MEVYHEFHFNRRLSTRELTMTALFVTLITAGAFIRVPLQTVHLHCRFYLLHWLVLY